MFLRNCWYVAAWDHEVLRMRMLRRVLLNEPVVLYRKTDGKPVALQDRCCHRHAPLSKGTLKGDRIECGYHGFTYDDTGKCVRIPGQDTVPDDARVKCYPVVERDHWIWIWMGDPDLADDGLIEDFHWMNDSQWRSKGELLRLAGNYLLLVENLCDLSHLPFVHPSSLGGSFVPKNEIPVKAARQGLSVRVERTALDTTPPPYFRAVAGLDRDLPVDRWMHLVFTPPAMVRIDIGAAPTASGVTDGDRGESYTTRNLNAITPETETSTHYFWAQAQNFALDDPTIADLDYRLVHDAFLEDLDIIEAQQTNIDFEPGAPRVNIATDLGGIEARRIIEELLDAEERGDNWAQRAFGGKAGGAPSAA